MRPRAGRRHPAARIHVLGLRALADAVAPSQRVGLQTWAYTLLELLAVITIMGIIAALAVPTLRGLKPNAKVAATRELLDAVGRARQLALSQRTTVYMVFVHDQLSRLARRVPVPGAPTT